MHRTFALFLVLGLLLIPTTIGCGGGGGGGFTPVPSLVFVHTATAGNITGNSTELNHPLLNGNPNALILVTQNWNPPGSLGVYNNHPIGVWYELLTNRWNIFNQDLAAMTLDCAFNVRIVTGLANALLHTATPANKAANYTRIASPLTDGIPNAQVLVTQNWNPPGSPGVYNNGVMGVWYTGAVWAVFNQDNATPIPDDAAFNCQVHGAGVNDFVHTATVGNITGNRTVISHPALDGNPSATFQVTQNWNPGGVGGTYNDAPIGVYYNGTNWAIFNEDLSAMPVNAAFNVSID